MDLDSRLMQRRSFTCLLNSQSTLRSSSERSLTWSNGPQILHVAFNSQSALMEWSHGPSRALQQPISVANVDVIRSTRSHTTETLPHFVESGTQLFHSVSDPPCESLRYFHFFLRTLSRMPADDGPPPRL